MRVRSLALLSGLSVAVSCGVGCRRGLDPTLLWLWCRPVAMALIGPLAWQPLYAAEAALEKAKRQKKKKKKKKKTLLGTQDRMIRLQMKLSTTVSQVLCHQVLLLHQSTTLVTLPTTLPLEGCLEKG